MPVIVLLCAVGSFATGKNLFAVITVAAFGAIGYVMERNGYPVAAMVLGIVMGTMVEQAFVTSLIKSDGIGDLYYLVLAKRGERPPVRR